MKKSSSMPTCRVPPPSLPPSPLPSCLHARPSFISGPINRAAPAGDSARRLSACCSLQVLGRHRQGAQEPCEARVVAGPSRPGSKALREEVAKRGGACKTAHLGVCRLVVLDHREGPLAPAHKLVIDHTELEAWATLRVLRVMWVYLSCPCQRAGPAGRCSPWGRRPQLAWLPGDVGKGKL